VKNTFGIAVNSKEYNFPILLFVLVLYVLVLTVNWGDGRGARLKVRLGPRAPNTLAPFLGFATILTGNQSH
jgi:hypothetical protein